MSGMKAAGESGWAVVRRLLGSQTIWEASSKFGAHFFMFLYPQTENPGDLGLPSPVNLGISVDTG